jgi:putative membrane protein
MEPPRQSTVYAAEIQEIPMKHLAIVSLAVVLAGPAFAQSAAEKTGVNSLIGVAPKTEDFVQEAATIDMFEIASSKLAFERGDDATKTFAQQMVSDHQKSIDELKALIASGKVKAPLPTAMRSGQQSILDKLNGLQGVDFNKQHHSDQVSVPEDAVDLFKRYDDEGDNADLKSWVASTRHALEPHLVMAKDLNE